MNNAAQRTEPPITCLHCGGSGQAEAFTVSHRMFVWRERTCRVCDGRGQVTAERYTARIAVLQDKITTKLQLSYINCNQNRSYRDEKSHDE